MISGSLAKDPCTIAPVDGGRSAVVATDQLPSLGGLSAGGPLTAHPSYTSPSSSKEVLPAPLDTAMSSTTTPFACTESSLA